METIKYIIYSNANEVHVMTQKQEPEWRRKALTEWSCDLEDFERKEVISTDGIQITHSTNLVFK